jgi:hypothetical protein
MIMRKKEMTLGPPTDSTKLIPPVGIIRPKLDGEQREALDPC